MNIAKKTNVANCPDCEEEINFNMMPKQGQKFFCPHCEASLEVVNVKPLQIDWDDSVYEEEWDSDDDEDDDDW